MTRALAAALALLVLPAALAAQARRCVLQVEQVGDSGVRARGPEGEDYFAGGGVRLRCLDLGITIRSDSVASYAGRVIHFVGRYRYRDSTLALDADQATYYRLEERWEARGSVRAVNRRTGSVLTGPSLDYYRAVRGLRDSTETYATGRPRLDVQPRGRAEGDSAAPYVVRADRLRIRGEDVLYAGGTVEVDRSDFATRSDSLRLDADGAEEGTLVGQAVMRGTGRDSFELTGARIDFTLRDRALERVLATGGPVASRRDVRLTGDRIVFELEDSVVARTFAWGDSTQGAAASPDYDVKADSLAIESPGGTLREIRGLGRGWLATARDSATGHRDWMAGDTVVARFRPGEPADSADAVLQELEGRGASRAYYRGASKGGDARPTLSYARADRLLVRMQRRPGEQGVATVELEGNVDGLQLQPGGGDAAPRPAPVPPGGGR